MSPTSDTQLVPGLNFIDATALVVGIVIGTGAFLKAAVMAQVVFTPVLVLSAWIGAGLLSLAGALTYAELGAMLPVAGGEYVYLREAYGNGPAFLYGWMRLTVASTGIIASLAIGFATFLSAVLPLNAVWEARTLTFFGQAFHWQFGPQQALAIGLIVLLSAVNCAEVAFGGHLQSAITLLKLFSIAAIVIGVLFFSHGVHISNLATPINTPRWAGMSAFSVAMLAALWGYDGWNQMPMVAGEVRNPQRDVPRALLTGIAIVIVVYAMLNLVYFLVLPFHEVLTSNSTAYRDALPVATKASQTFLGSMGAKVVSIVFAVSALGALNGSILTCARVPFAMARDGLFFNRFGRVSQGSRVPVFSIAVQGIWSSVLALSGTFDQLTDYVIFASWIFYALVVSAVFVLRRKMPHAVRPYRTVGYPLVPIVFIVTAGWLIVYTLQTRPAEAVVGLLLIAAGLPLYAHFARLRRKADADSTLQSTISQGEL